MESFTDHPPTIGELRADKSHLCSDWSPRDALIDVLRKIDSGMKCDALVVCWTETVDGKEKGRFRMAAPSSLTGLGLLAYTSHEIMVE